MTSSACDGVDPSEVISTNSIRAALQLYHDQIVEGEYHRGPREVILHIDDYSKISKIIIDSNSHVAERTMKGALSVNEL